jgi:hypothetical protein
MTGTPDAYLRGVLAGHSSSASPLAIAALRAVLEPSLRRWGASYLRDVAVSGSNAKGTAVGGQTDVDFFISLDSSCPGTLKQIYWSLYEWAGAEGWSPRPQNVSIGINVVGHKVDLVPARVQTGYVNRHSVYRRKADSWTQTDVARHISLVSGSGRTEEIRLTKIWRAQNGLEFPSLALELAVLLATHGRRIGQIADNFWAVLGFLADSFSSMRPIDPSNTANIVSDDLTLAEKAAITRAAKASRGLTYWENIIQ